METVMKKELENAVVDLNGFQIYYNLLRGENGRYGIARRCRKSGRPLSNYINHNLFSAHAAAQKTFRILVDNAELSLFIFLTFCSICRLQAMNRPLRQLRKV